MPRNAWQGRNHGKNLGATKALDLRCYFCNCGQNQPPPPCCNRVRVSQNLGVTLVAPVAPAVTVIFAHI